MTTSPFDEAPPRRPDLALDFAGATLVDETGYVPDPTQMPSAAVWNQLCNVAAAIGRTMPVAILEVSAAAAVTGASYARSTAPATTPTAVLNGAGDITVSWDAADFPGAILAPVALVRGSTAATCAVEALTPGARVRSGSAVPFTLLIY